MTPADRATTRGLARSVQTRLLRHGHVRGIDPNVVLARYAAERLLYRVVSLSERGTSAIRKRGASPLRTLMALAAAMRDAAAADRKATSNAGH